MENELSKQEGKGLEAIKAKKNIKMFVIGLVGLLALVIVIVLGLGLYRIYNKQTTDVLTVSLAKVLRLPIGKVNGTVIYYTDYVSDLKAIQTLNNWQIAQSGDTSTNMNEEEMSDAVLERMAGSVVVNQLAKEFSITVSEDEITKEKETAVANFESEEQFANEVVARYGWTLDEYREKAIIPKIMQDKVMTAIETDPTKLSGAITEKRQKMDDILKQVQAGGDFAELAKQYGEDNTAAEGGDLGWFSKDEMVPQFEDAAFSLKDGEVYPEVVESTYGFHIIKVEGRRTTEKVEEINARHIFMRYPDATIYLQQIFKQAQINLYGNIHNPFATDTEENIQEETTPTTTE
jgi:uncharacterized protein (DUF433 family)